MNTILQFNYKDHSQIVGSWGKKHGFPLPPELFLPDIGFIMNDAAVGFLYTTNSKLAWLEWVFSNPEKTKEERSESLDLLISHLIKVAKEKGCKGIFSAASVPAYERILDRNGFMGTDKNMNHFVLSLGV